MSTPAPNVIPPAAWERMPWHPKSQLIAELDKELLSKARLVADLDRELRRLDRAIGKRKETLEELGRDVERPLPEDTTAPTAPVMPALTAKERREARARLRVAAEEADAWVDPRWPDKAPNHARARAKRADLAERAHRARIIDAAADVARYSKLRAVS